MKIINSVGGLGSQMMAYGLFLAVKERYRNEKVFYDTSWFRHIETDLGEQLEDIFGIKEKKIPDLLGALINSQKLKYRILRYVLKKLRLYKVFVADKYNFDPNVFCLRGTHILYQCWTSELFFSDQKDKLKKAFSFPEFDISDIKNLEILKIIENSKSVALHIRRGDFVGNDALGNLAPIFYYEEAIGLIQSKIKDPVFIVFSDDINWARMNLELNNAFYVDWNSGTNSFRDMQLISRCRNAIIPNSSFSWCGAWLIANNDKIVICPERWVSPESGLEEKDIAAEGWISIRNY